MKKSFLLFVLGVTILSITGCNKDTGGSNPALAPLKIDTTPPTAGAGSDVIVFLPADSCMLFGWTVIHKNGIASYKWTKISGPSSVKLSDPDSLSTGVKDLIQGVYEFELTVTDKIGMRDTDTMYVTVGNLSTREISFKNVSWGPEEQNNLFGAAFLTIKNIYSQIPMGSVFKVFMMKINDVGWVEVPAYQSPGSENARYTYNIYDSNLYVLSPDEERSSADIMIVY